MMTQNMTYIQQFFRCYLILLFIYNVNGLFAPDTSNYDAYGVKIAMNENFLVLAQNDPLINSFFIQFAPYNNTQPSSSNPLSSAQCYLTYPNSVNIFIYTVALGKKQNQNQIQFFFAGELIGDQSGPYVGIATYNNTSNISDIISLSSCDSSFSYSFHNLTYEHQDFYILGVDPTGVLAYGFTNQFVFVFDSTNTSNFNSWNGTSTWKDTTFLPHAVDISDTFGVVAGFIYNGENATVIYSPMIYLINFYSSNHHQPVIIDQYKPIQNPGTWQDLLTNEDAGVYLAKYDMSVSIDQQGNVLVGMQFINRVFLFSVDVNNPIRFTPVNRYTNGRSLGNGKSIAWLDNGIAAILINVYSLTYQWSQSQVFFFDMYETVFNSTTTPLSVFPNSHQLLPSSFSSTFLNVVSSPSSLALLDDGGNILVFSPTQPGFYPSVRDTGLMPIFTSPVQCLSGTYKDRSGVHDCVLCPTGTRDPGDSNIQCIPCASDSFCPLGSVADIPSSTLVPVRQVVPYPLSPESVIFDEILLHNMFNIGPGHCTVVSPLFWALIVAAVVVIIIIIMEVSKICIKHPRIHRIRNITKHVFKHTDLIGEGEFWIGGLASFSIIVLVSFAIAFSNAYLKQYPIETSSPSYFACDPKMRNAKFQTNVQSLAIPFVDVELPLVTLLNGQQFTLNVHFINTLMNCNAISIVGKYGTTSTMLRWLTCNNTDSILTLSIQLPSQQATVEITLDDVDTIGGLSIGLSGPPHEIEGYTLKELNFTEVFLKNGFIVSQTLPIYLALTKIINETKPMTGDESTFTGIYVSTFTVDMNSLFVSIDQYVRSSLTSTILTIEITETPYYVKNLQEPIARQPEIIFRNLLFTVVCLEIYGLAFIFYILAFRPLFRFIRRKYAGDNGTTGSNEKLVNGDLLHVTDRYNSIETDSIFISSTF